mgnify:CR=1 FL=1
MERKSLKVGLFVPCCVDQFGVATAANMVKILESSGVECHYEPSLTCCGQRLYVQGQLESAKRLGTQLIEAFRPYSHVVTCSSLCAAYLRHDLPRLFAHSALFHEAQEFGAKVRELSDFLLNVLGGTPTALSFPHRVGLVEPARAQRDYPLSDEPKRLLRALEGLDLVELGTLDTDLLYAAAFPDIAVALWDNLLDRAARAGVQYLTSSEPSLLLQLKARIAKRGLEIHCRNLADVLV